MNNLLAFPTEYNKNVQSSIENTLDQWIDIHYGNLSFNGRVMFGSRKEGKPEIYQVAALYYQWLQKA